MTIQDAISTLPLIDTIKKSVQIEVCLGPPSNASSSIPLHSTVTNMTESGELPTERKSYAQAARLGLTARITNAVLSDRDMRSPSEYFDAKQNIGSSPEASSPSSHGYHPISRQNTIGYSMSVPPEPISKSSFRTYDGDGNIPSRRVSSAYSSTGSNASNTSPTMGRHYPIHDTPSHTPPSSIRNRTSKSSRSQTPVLVCQTPSNKTPRGKKGKGFGKNSKASSPLPASESSRTVSGESEKLTGSSSVSPKDSISRIGDPGLSEVDSKSTSSLAASRLDLIDNLQNQFGKPEYSDLQILVGAQPSQHPRNFPAAASGYEVFYVHMAVLDGSPFLRQVLEAKAYQHDDGLHYIHAVLGPSFNVVPALSMALQYLYSTPLVTKENLRDVVLASTLHTLQYGASPLPFQVERAMVHFALCYATSGIFLNLPEVTKRGMELAHGLLSWNTVEMILHFGMAATSYMITCPELGKFLISSPTSSSTEPQDTWPPKISLSHIKDFEDKWPAFILNIAMEFVINAITADFKIYERAQAQFTPSRIPDALWTLPKSYCSDPRLERIRLGSMPSFADIAPTDPAILVPSAMLLTLPFKHFAKFLAMLKKRGKADVALIQEVILAREERRMRAVWKYQSQVWAPGILHELSLEELGYREIFTINDQITDILKPLIQRVFVGLKHPKMEELKCTQEENMKNNKKAEGKGGKGKN